MQETYLIQRLKKPFEPAKTERGLLFQKCATGLAFGGGLINGGLSKEAMELFRPIFRFDYMGSAEFEFGAVPKALSKIFTDKSNYVVGYIDFANNVNSVVCYICHKDHEQEVQKRIKKLAVNEIDFRLKERCKLSEVLEGTTYSKDIGGWLELNNGYMFFTDTNMSEKIIELFGISD